MSNKMHTVIIFVISFVVFIDAYPRIPPNPCPLIFNYYSNSDDTIFGEIVVPNDGTKVFRMEVNTSYVGLFDERSRPRLKLDLTTVSDYILQSKQLTYKLTFTRQDIIPRITQIKFNDRIYCKGPSEPLTSSGVSELWVYKETRLQTFPYYPDQPMTIRPQIPTRPTMPPFIPPITTTTSPGPSYWTERPFRPDDEIAPAPLVDITQNDPECGISDRTINLINGGSTTVKNEFPWLVAVYKFRQLNYEFTCTGSLIDRNHVVTAAHCVKFFKADLQRKEDLLLIFGASNLEQWPESPDVIKRRVSRIDVHPDYRQYSGHGDIAVLTLNRPIDYSKIIKPICLWSDYEDLSYVVGKYGTIAGWGKDDQQQSYLSDVKRVEMPIVSQDTCVRSNYDFQKLTSDRTFCAGERNGKGPCTGDSGSPFMINKNGKWFLRGLLSQVIFDDRTQKCNLREYAVFVDAGKYNKWIRSNSH